MLNPRRACAVRVTVVVVCVHLSVQSQLTFGASVHPENAVTYSTGNKFVGVSLKLLHSRTTAHTVFVQSIFSLQNMHGAGHHMSNTNGFSGSS